MFVIVDTETTGGNPSKDRIMEIAIYRHNGQEIVDEYSTLLNPGVPIPPFVQHLTGINEGMLVDAPTFAEVAENIERITKDAVFVAHNVNFDYGILRNEFRRFGKFFSRKQLCTVKLTKKLLPGLKSYSLGKLCREIGIPIENRHRAGGDALATVHLFDRLLNSDSEGIIKHSLEEELDHRYLPSLLKAESIDFLPEATGVLFFHSIEGKILYLSKAKNIRKKVLEMFVQGEEFPRIQKLKEEVSEVTYEITGSELVGFLMESEELQKHHPPYNSSLRKRQYKYGIYSYPHDDGYMRLTVSPLSEDLVPIVEFTNRKSALSVINRWITKYHFHPPFCKPGMSEGEIEYPFPAEIYNEHVRKILQRYRYPHASFFIIGDGRSHHEQSIVWIENNKYMGYGYFEPEYMDQDVHSFKEFVKPGKDSPDMHRIIRSWLEKKTKDEIIPYVTDEAMI